MTHLLTPSFNDFQLLLDAMKKAITNKFCVKLSSCLMDGELKWS